MRGVRRATPRRPSAASVMSREVTTLLLGLRGSGLGLAWGLGLGAWGLGLGGGGTRCLVVVPVLVDRFVFVFLDDARDIHDQVAGGQVHDLHALRVAAGNPDPLDRHADHDAFLGDHHQLVVRQDLFQRDDLAGFIAALQRDDAAAAAMLDAVFVQLGPLAHTLFHAAHRYGKGYGPLAHTLFRNGEQRGFAAHHDHIDHMVSLVELDPFHAGRRAAHVAHVFFVEADAHAMRGREHDVVLAVRHLDVDELVALFNIHGPT